MKQTFKVLVAIFALTVAAQTFADKLVWSVSGLKMPESVEYDKVNDRYYVSNLNGGVKLKDGNGSIGLIDGSGKLLDVDWVKGLHSPKGLALHNNKLYVADVKQLVVINVNSGKIIARYMAEESEVLNGIAVNKNGTVFVSDWLENRIYKLEEGELKLWLETAKLNSPNGLWVDTKHLYVASWGAGLNDDFSTATSGNIKKISLKTKTITTLPQGKHWFNMDGIFPYSTGKWLVSDYIKGEVFVLNAYGKVEKSLKLKKGAADFYYIDNKKLLIVPLMEDNQVVAYTLD
ncbi:MAG: hypothetical protein methR_P1833 [Methyloprofundus sp.]|nr:MAG: hypothetical protein methR_P1833 [Methyloprofundus sp.]